MRDVYELFSVEGKKAIVTGGSRGLCRAMAQVLHDGGAEVVLVASNPDRLRAAADEMGADGTPVHWAAADLSCRDEVDRVYDEALGLLDGRLDVLVNGAGLQYRCDAADYPADRWDAIVAVNLTATMAMAQRAGRTMLAQGGGKIVNVASMTSFFGSVMIPAYAASKGGVAQLTKALANEWTAGGVNVNAVAPGYMETALTADMQRKNPAQYAEVTGRIPAGRWGTPEDLDGVTLFLSSAASDYVSGAVIPVDGGYLGK